MQQQQGILALETGQIFYGRSIGVAGTSVGEVVFNTALTGYQEILTDPSYSQQLITFTYPHIGNTGINFEDNQSRQIFAAGLIVKSLSNYVSNWRAKISLREYLLQQQCVGLEGIDTRGLTIILRNHGALRGCIMTSENLDVTAAVNAARQFKGLKNLDLASIVSTRQAYKVAATTHNPQHFSKQVVLVDFGVKHNILECLTSLGCEVTVVPAQTAAKEILKLRPDGILLSNGPGDPAACAAIIDNIKELVAAAIPIYGICLGHQLLALALGATTYKMDFGHHGSNHPVLDIMRNRVMITSQNHGFAVAADSLPHEIAVTHRSLFDNSLQGFKHKNLPLFGFQGHPEAAPGPHDALHLFEDFVYAMRESNAKAFEFA